MGILGRAKVCICSIERGEVVQKLSLAVGVHWSWGERHGCCRVMKAEVVIEVWWRAV